ncbi:MAG: hypothetical protein LBC83_07025 [Oscillospiraceae bacterium]|jgi:hypothetical protein|nr:hypothetical protein [Oscillospiraceae bacterium]
MKSTIGAAEAALLAQDSKIALLGTLDETGCPHITFFNSLQGLGDQQLTFGQFMVGQSKTFLPQRPDCAFLALSADMNWLRGRARYTHKETGGAEYEMYNNKPLFRYNTYFGINTVWYLDLLGISEIQKLPMPQIAAGAILTRVAAALRGKSEKGALALFSRQLFAKLDGLKFLCYADAQGALNLVPIIQATHAGADRAVFLPTPYGKLLKDAPQGCRAAILAVNLELQSVLVKGTLAKRSGAFTLDIDRVYNPMPPAVGYIYPKAAKPAPVTAF